MAESPSGIGLYHAASGTRMALLTHPDLRPFGALAQNQDGSILVATSIPSSVQIWNLRALRQELAALGLDWQ